MTTSSSPTSITSAAAAAPHAAVHQCMLGVHRQPWMDSCVPMQLLCTETMVVFRLNEFVLGSFSTWPLTHAWLKGDVMASTSLCAFSPLLNGVSVTCSSLFIRQVCRDRWSSGKMEQESLPNIDFPERLWQDRDAGRLEVKHYQQITSVSSEKERIWIFRKENHKVKER